MPFIHALHLVLACMLVISNLLTIPFVAIFGFFIGDLFATEIMDLPEASQWLPLLSIAGAFVAVGLINGIIALNAMRLWSRTHDAGSTNGNRTVAKSMPSMTSEPLSVKAKSPRLADADGTKPKKTRGRPKGSKNPPKAKSGRRGRPKGSKNARKAKSAQVEQTS